MSFRSQYLIIIAVLCALCAVTHSKTCSEIPHDQRPPECISYKAFPNCCKNYDEIAELDGVEVFFTGRYEPVHVSKRVTPSARLEDVRTVQIVSPHGPRVMLGIYYDASGQRSADEIVRFRGKQVRVAGRIHAHTPEQQSPDGTKLQSMVGPYLSDFTISAAQ